MDKKQEKRLSKRQEVRIRFRYQMLNKGMPQGESFEAGTNDLSTTGLSFLSAVQILLDSELRIGLLLPQHPEPMLIDGKVTRIEKTLEGRVYSIGIMFFEISEEDKETIAKGLKSLDLYDLLSEVLDKNASDLHLTVGRSPIIRVQGKLHFLQREPIRNREVEAMIYPLLQQTQIDNLFAKRELDFAFSPNLDSRFRVNLHWQRGFLEGALRAIPTKIKSMKELGLPKAAHDLAFSKQGLVLVSGPTNSGKTTTLAAMVEAVNQKEEAIVICIEDPIEYVHKAKKSIIKQRELGVDTLSYSEALKRSLRQDPDIIVVGEIVDLDCVLAALQAAETGHLVLTSIHASKSAQALERVIHMFPVEHKDEICIRLSSCLQGVISQILLPSTDGKKQVLATETLTTNHAVKHLIRENRLNQLMSVIEGGSQYHMHTLEKSLDELFTKGLISVGTLTQFKQDIASKRGE